MADFESDKIEEAYWALRRATSTFEQATGKQYTIVFIPHSQSEGIVAWMTRISGGVIANANELVHHLERALLERAGYIRWQCIYG